MEIERRDGTLSITGLRELTNINSRAFRHNACAALSPELRAIEIDLSQTRSVDGSGVGALMKFYIAATEQGGGPVAVRLLNPAPPVQQMFELTRVHHLFEIIPPDATARTAGSDHSSA
jgi:anti-sigma B factor antagonist